MPTTVILEVQNHVASITLNRPDVMNAINTQMARDLVDVCQLIADDQDVWVVTLQAAGDRAFSVGADLKEREHMPVEQWRAQRVLGLRAYRALAAVERPMIAAVDGYALGGGCELALACDFIIAGERAQFALPEARVGIIPGGGGTQLLPRRVGPAMAKELIFTGRRIDATEALRIGLVNRVVPSQDLGTTVDAITGEILGVSPVSARQAKRAVDRGIGQDLWSGWALEEEAYVACLYSADRLEGMAAFHEKRAPRFQNR
ncbi:MAG: enoyl-CoA hydratase/isomerase family protein [Chloroflexota bacterium]